MEVASGTRDTQEISTAISTVIIKKIDFEHFKCENLMQNIISYMMNEEKSINYVMEIFMNLGT